MKKDKNKFYGCFAGLAVGDALGAPVEFFPPGSFKPITDMVEGGKLKLAKGEFTDDTSMALCLAESLLRSDGFDPYDQMECYCDWALHGRFSSRDYAFGFGQTFMTTFHKYRRTGDPFAGCINPKRPGNGCIMRLAPIPLFFFPDEARIVYYSGESSKTTHGHPESIFASRLFGCMIFRALSGRSKEDVLFDHAPEPGAPENILQIAQGKYKNKKEADIESTFFAGKCLEAALWSFYHTGSYKEAVLKAANLGGDADSTAAVCGQIAGAYYGYEAIPKSWIEALVKKEMIIHMAERLYSRGLP
jgi:ADP-ribosyl-[dinitrogen reductase] hydrolase